MTDAPRCLERDDADGSTVLVGHDRHLESLLAEQAQQRVAAQGSGDAQRIPELDDLPCCVTRMDSRHPHPGSHDIRGGMIRKTQGAAQEFSVILIR